MKQERRREGTSIRSLLRGTSVLAGIATLLTAAPLTFAQDTGEMETVTVTGYRAALTQSVNSKRTTANFTDSVFAEDIGKFPDLNIAESINRIPGVQLNRDGTGEGTQITVRGLGPSFTNILMNGHPIEVATDGTTGSGNQNREVDLDMFPVELFTKINVSKTPTADLTEGGIAGTVNLGTVKPFDNPEEGFHLAYSLQDEYNDIGGSFSPRGAIIASQNWGNKLGILVAVAGQHYLWRTDGYENVGNALAGLSDQLGATACPTSACNTIGTGKNFHWATVVPPGVAPNAALGIGAVGTPYNYSGCLNTAGGTSGMSTAALSNVIFPYLAREDFKGGDRNRMSFLTDVQYRPFDNFEANLNVMYENSQRDYHATDLDWYVRNSCNTAGTTSSCMIPENVQADSLGYLTSGTFLNSTFFLEHAVFRENVAFLDINPTIDWTPKPWLTIHGGVDYNDSYMHRRNWTYMFQTTPGSGYTADYKMGPGQDVPTITTNAPINDPTSASWQWYQARVQPLYRNTVERGTNWDVTIGDDKANLKFGYAYQQTYRFINAEDNGTDVTACVIGPSTASAPCTMPDGTVEPAGTAGLVPNSALSSYLTKFPAGDFMSQAKGAGYTSYIYLNQSALDKATDIEGFVNTAPFTPTGAVGAQKSGSINEKTQNGYVEANGVVQFMDRDIHLNGGLRYYNTDQIITGPVSENGTSVMFSSNHTYEGILPSLNIAADVWDNVVFRAAGSKTMTRAAPSAMLPGVAFGSALLSPVTAGNPNLQPYYSDNADLGLEWYTGGPGIVAIDYFRKDISNFTMATSIQEPFSATGIPFSSLQAGQITDYNANGGPNEIVTVNTTVNLQEKLHIQGFELNVVQPLDLLLQGAGFTGTFTRITKSLDPGLTLSQAQGIATGLAPYTYNLGAYYENYGASLRVTYNFVDRNVSGATPASQGINQPSYTDSYGQLDLSASYTLPWLTGTVLEGAQISFDALNLTGSFMKSYTGDTNSPGAVFYPGTSLIVGFRGKF